MFISVSEFIGSPVFTGGKLTYQTAKKRAKGPRCPVTGKRIQGVAIQSLSCIFFLSEFCIMDECHLCDNCFLWHLSWIVPLDCYMQEYINY